jgi:hypothetical protein
MRSIAPHGRQNAAMPTNPHDHDRDGLDAEGRDEAERHREAEELAEEIVEENPDPITRREALELELEDEDLSDEGRTIGEHNE